MAAYIRLHQAGRAHSVEVWDDDALVGGLYGLNTGLLFCGESMFSRVSNGSKSLYDLFAHFTGHGGRMFDCQILNHYTESFGAREIPRQAFIRQLYQLRDNHLPQSCWQPQTLARPVPSQLPPFYKIAVNQQEMVCFSPFYVSDAVLKNIIPLHNPGFRHYLAV